MNRVKDKIVLVTGASRGLGYADTRLLVDEGARVIATDRPDADYTALKSMGVDCRFLDVREETAWEKSVKSIVSDYGRLDVLVNNAGVIHVGDPVSFDFSQWRHMCAVNIEGMMLGCKYVLPVMTEQRSGSIINTSSIASNTGLYFYAGYCASKGAVAAYTRAVAVYCAQNKLGIRCNSVHPGGIDTDMNDDLAAEFAVKIAGMRLPPQSPVSEDGPKMRMGVPDDIAWAVVYLASDESAFMNGAEMRIDNTASITAAAVG